MIATVEIERDAAEEAKPRLPDGWRWSKLGEVCSRMANGTTATQNPQRTGLPVSRIETISGSVINEERVGWIDASRDELGKYILCPGDILFSHINSFERLGNCALYEGKPPGLIHGMNLLRFEIRRELAEPFFVLLWLKTENARSFYNDRARRAIGQASLNTKDLHELEIPLPPLAEQKRIAGILKEQMAAVERARRSAAAQLQAAEALPTAYLRVVFICPEAQAWQKKRLGEHVTKIGSALTPLGGQTSYQQSGVPLIRSQNIHMNRFERGGLAFISDGQDAEMEGSRVEKNDVLLNITGASIGRVCVVPTEICPANVNQHVSIIRSDGFFEPAFLSFYISTPDFQKFILGSQAGATRQALTKTMIEDFQIPFPSLTDQRRITTELSTQMSSAERLCQTLAEQLDAINKLPGALLREAFSGRL